MFRAHVHPRHQHHDSFSTTTSEPPSGPTDPDHILHADATAHTHWNTNSSDAPLPPPPGPTDEQKQLFNKLFRHYVSHDTYARKVLTHCYLGPQTDVTCLAEDMVQDVPDKDSLQYQCTVHQQMAAVLAAFVFSALISESSTDLSKIVDYHPGRRTEDPGAESSFLKNQFGGKKFFLFDLNNDTGFVLVNVLDQLRVGMMGVSFFFFVRALMMFVYVDMYLTTRAFKHFPLSLAQIVTNECQTFHYALFAMVFSIPLYSFKFFGPQPVTFLLIPFCLAMPHWLFGAVSAMGVVGRLAKRAEFNLLKETDVDVDSAVSGAGAHGGGRYTRHKQYFSDVPPLFQVDPEVCEERLKACSWADLKNCGFPHPESWAGRTRGNGKRGGVSGGSRGGERNNRRGGGKVGDGDVVGGR